MTTETEAHLRELLAKIQLEQPPFECGPSLTKAEYRCWRYFYEEAPALLDESARLRKDNERLRALILDMYIHGGPGDGSDLTAEMWDAASRAARADLQDQPTAPAAG